MDDLEGLLKCLGRKGAMQILGALTHTKELNFNALAKKVGYSVTADRILRDCSSHGLIMKRELKDRLGTVKYSLTEKGLRVASILEQMRKA